MLDLWVKIPVSFTSDLPTSRPYSPIEAAFSFERDRLFNKQKSIRDYAKIWSWSKSKVDRFIKEYGDQSDVDQVIKNDQIRGTKAGQKRDKSGTHKGLENGMLRVCLGQTRDNSGTNAGHILIREREEIKEDSTSDDSKVLFDLWNTITAGVPSKSVRSFNSERKIKCTKRLKERPINEWSTVFQMITQSTFCQSGNWCNFDWIIKNDSNADKVIEGKYSDSKSRNDENRYSMFAGA